MPLVLIPLASLVALLIGWAMIELVKSWGTPFVGTHTGRIGSFTQFLKIITWPIYALTQAAEHKLRDVATRLGAAILPTDFHVSKFFTGVAELADQTGMALGNLAAGTLHALHSLRHATIPRLLHATVLPLRRSLASLWRYAAHTLPAEIAHVGSLARSVAITVPREIAIGERVVSDWVGYTRRNLTKHLRLIAAGLATAVGAGVLARAIARELAWGRCANVNRVGKALCGTPRHFLNDLLGLLGDFFILTNICRVIPWLESAFQLTAAPLIAQLAPIGAGLCNASYAREPDLTLPQLYTPNTAFSQLYTP